MGNSHYADLKFPLIDLEVGNTTTGGKQESISMQPERLSEESNMYNVYWIHLKSQNDIYLEGYVGITSNFVNRMSSHNRNKYKNHFKYAINKYGWNNLYKEIIHSNLTLIEALKFEELYRPVQNIGWNSQKGGIIGVEKEWYNIPENKLKHQINTSKATKIAIKEKDNYINRSNRAKNNWKNKPESYKKVSMGSNNPKAKLNEYIVYNIKFNLIPSGMSNKDIALLYKVEDYVIAFIRNNKTWKHVVCDSPAHK